VERFLSGETDVGKILDFAEKRSISDINGNRWGDIGYIKKGTFPASVELYLFSMNKVGQVVRIDTEDGADIFRLMDIRESHLLPYETVRTAVKEALFRKTLLSGIRKLIRGEEDNGRGLR
jgi:hypothetical protein